MDVLPTDEHMMIRDALARFLERAGGLEPAFRVSEGGEACELWRGIAEELQVTAIGLPEACGGLGADMRALVAVGRELGKVLAPVPFVSTVALAGQVLAAATPGRCRDGWLSRIAGGTAQAVLAHGADAAGDCWDTPAFRVEQAGDGYVLEGQSGPIPDLMGADLVLVPALCAGQRLLIALEGEALSGHRRPCAPMDVTQPTGVLELTDLLIPASAVLDRGTAFAGRCDTSLDRARLVLAAEMAGAARGAFTLTLEYIAERRQFGRTIASYQAIKHRMADLYVRLNRLDALIDGAAADFDRSANASDGAVLAGAEARAAKALACEELFAVSAEAIQLHGGVGMTFEYAPHLFFKRATAMRALSAGPVAAFRQIGLDLLDGRLSALPVSGAASEAETALRRAVAGWMAENLTGEFEPLRGRGGAGDGDALPALRKAWEQRLAAGGWVGLGLPEALGGRGMSVGDQVIFNEEYARAGGPGRMGHIGEGLLAPTLAAFGTEDQRARFLPGILQGTTFWAQGYSEPGAGSDLAALRTRARRDPASGDWIIYGQKTWTSLAHLSDWIFVLARAEEGATGRDGLIFLLMPLDQPGIDIRPIRQINGACEFNEVFFDGAVARAEDAVGAPGEGWAIAMALLGFERGISTLGQQMGFARELEAVVSLARQARDPMDHAEALGRAWTGLRAMRHGAMRVLGAVERGEPGPEALGYKYEWSNWHRSLGELAMDALGPEAAVHASEPGIARLQQLYLFARAETIYGGTNEIQLNIISEQGLGMPREPRGQTQSGVR
ncbi:acyl-CoA dehydrogenase [Stappia stellulata]|uniref:acyl-CoA dehydrogenase n=1 Tax=Stappia stellulata TaxID=71235 RepID=UPI001CD4BD44|nr:acyl-CoA dehydrogenase [Stappia stellulata]MCA1244200.1 acyl-CoA dehydrogenase [Stappia stellulata]